MNIKKNTASSIVLTLLLILLFAFLYYRFADFLFHLNSYVVGATGDTLKNYYTCLFQARWGDSVIMHGMAYPYGQHVVYTDGQPVLAFIINALHLTDYGVGIIHGWMILSFFLSAMFIFLIMRKAELPAWYSLLTTLIIVLLSPQIYRMAGHFGLASLFYIPMMWYFLLRAIESKRSWLWYAGIATVIMFHGLLHPYHFMIGAFFLLSYAFVYLIQQRRQFGTIKYRLLALVLTAMLPIGIFMLGMKLTDKVTDRGVPATIIDYYASFDSVFLPTYSPLKFALNVFYTTEEVKWEGLVFVGCISTLILAFSLIRIFRRIRAKKYKQVLSPPLPVELKTLVWASFIVLFISMALPFRWGMEWLLAYTPLLKNFRSLGRFAWVFYSVFTIYVAYYLFTIYKLLSRTRKQFGVIFITLALMSWALDAWVNFTNATDVMTHPHENFFTKDFHYKEELRKNNLSIESFQAMLPIPFFVVGTEKIEPPAEPGIHPFVISYQTGMPMFAIMASRSSFLQSENVKQLLAADEIEKDILKECNQKPILVVHSFNQPINEVEASFLRKCKLIGRIDGADLYLLEVQQLHTKDAIVQYFDKVKPSLISHNGYLCNAATNVVFRESFDNRPNDKAIFGKGAFVVENDYQTFLDKYALPVQEDSVPYEASVWLYLDPTINRGTAIDLVRCNDKDSVLSVSSVWQGGSYDIYKQWTRISFVFIAGQKNEKISLACSLKGATIDEVLVRPLNTDVYYDLTDKSFMKNNYLIRR